MAVQPRRAWFQPVARQAAPVPVPAAPSAPAPRPPIVRPALPSQTQKPNPSPPLAATSPQRSPVAPPAQALPTPKSLVAPAAPAPSTPRSPFAPQPLLNISPSASKSPTIPKPIAAAIRNGLVPASSPKIAKPLETTPVQSPKTKPVSRPPSPLTLPPAQIKTESAHETMIPTEVQQNKGAIMEFGPSPNNDYSAGNPLSHHQTISIKDGSDGEQSSIARSELLRYKDKFNKAKAIMNCNFQGVNNSILYDCTFTQDPGKGTGGNGIHLKNHLN